MSNEALNDALDEALNDALKSKYVELIRINPRLTQTELASKLGTSRSTIQGITKDFKDARILCCTFLTSQVYSIFSLVVLSYLYFTVALYNNILIYKLLSNPIFIRALKILEVF